MNTESKAIACSCHLSSFNACYRKGHCTDCASVSVSEHRLCSPMVCCWLSIMCRSLIFRLHSRRPVHMGWGRLHWYCIRYSTVHISLPRKVAPMLTPVSSFHVFSTLSPSSKLLHKTIPLHHTLPRSFSLLIKALFQRLSPSSLGYHLISQLLFEIFSWAPKNLWTTLSDGHYIYLEAVDWTLRKSKGFKHMTTGHRHIPIILESVKLLQENRSSRQAWTTQ